MRIRRTAVAAVILATTLPFSALAATPSAHTGLGIRLLDVSASLVNDPRAHSYIIDRVAPGSTLTRHVEVLNDTGHSAHILLYSNAAHIASGEFLPDPKAQVNDITRWVSVRPSSIELAQAQSAVATVTISVPSNASSGERYGVVYAELPASPVAGGVSLASRVGIRVYLSVGFGAAPPSDFRITTMRAGRTSNGNPEVQATVRNIGGRALDMSGQLWLRDGPGGLSAGPFPAQLGTTLGIGQKEPVTVILDRQIPSGPWLARLELQSDLVRHAAEATITFPANDATFGKAVRATAIPLSRNKKALELIAGSLILLILIGIGLILFLVWRRRRRDEEEAGVGTPSPIQPPRPRRPAEEGSRTGQRRR